MQANQLLHTVRAAQGPRHAPTTDPTEAMQQPIGVAVVGGRGRGRGRGLLVWSAVTLLAALALALVMVLASLASAPADPAPPSRPPMQFGPSVGHARPE
jgi:hypothetical protein